MTTPARIQLRYLGLAFLAAAAYTVVADLVPELGQWLSKASVAIGLMVGGGMAGIKRAYEAGRAEAAERPHV